MEGVAVRRRTVIAPVGAEVPGGGGAAAGPGQRRRIARESRQNAEACQADLDAPAAEGGGRKSFGKMAGDAII